MGFFDIFFGKKEESQPEEIQEVEVKERDDNYEIQGICDYCKNDIKTNEKMTKFAKQTFHRKCLKKMKKDATKIAFG